jgi:heptose-I-phosphate ethanolaminephosphotransferase
MYAVPFFFWVGQNEYLNSKFTDPSKFIRQYSLSDFIYTYTDFLDIKFNDFISHQSILSSDFLEDNIIVGNPYLKEMSRLNGTEHIIESH